MNEQEKKQVIKNVYIALKNRDVNPSGIFDKVGRWYAEHGELINVRAPSRAWPYSQMQACRTHKYVKAVAEKFGFESEKELLGLI